MFLWCGCLEMGSTDSWDWATQCPSLHLMFVYLTDSLWSESHTMCCYGRYVSVGVWRWGVRTAGTGQHNVQVNTDENRSVAEIRHQESDMRCPVFHGVDQRWPGVHVGSRWVIVVKVGYSGQGGL